MWRRHLVWGLCCCQPPQLTQRCFQAHYSSLLLQNLQISLDCKDCVMSWARSAPVLMHLPVVHLAVSSSTLFSMFQWWNVFLLLPSLSLPCLRLSAWGLWDCGRASLSRQRAVLPNWVHLGFGVSLYLYSFLSFFILPFSPVFFGVAEASRTPCSLLSLALLSLSPSKVLTRT